MTEVRFTCCINFEGGGGAFPGAGGFVGIDFPGFIGGCGDSLGVGVPG